MENYTHNSFQSQQSDRNETPSDTSQSRPFPVMGNDFPNNPMFNFFDSTFLPQPQPPPYPVPQAYTQSQQAYAQSLSYMQPHLYSQAVSQSQSFQNILERYKSDKSRQTQQQQQHYLKRLPTQYVGKKNKQSPNNDVSTLQIQNNLNRANQQLSSVNSSLRGSYDGVYAETSSKPFKNKNNSNNISLPLPPPPSQARFLANIQSVPPVPPLPEEVIMNEEGEFEEFNEDSYDTYIPKKWLIGYPHPDPLVESTSLASCPPPDITYELHLPQKIIDKRKLSRAQLEFIAYASQKHLSFLPNGTRKGFFLGDGAGVGKGRQVAGIIYENWCQDRKKHVWLSASNDLAVDAKRDIDDIYANHMEQICLNKLSYNKIPHSSGILFVTYTSLISSNNGGSGGGGGKATRRIDQIIKWLGTDFDGCLIFDECHKAKNLYPTTKRSKPTKVGLCVHELQERLPKARVIYCSATGITEPANMAYMTRLGLWGTGSPFPNGFDEFLSSVSHGGIGMLEVIALHLKRQGYYLCRTLSYANCEFFIDQSAVTAAQTKVYDDATAFWIQILQDLNRYLDYDVFMRYFQRKRKSNFIADSDEEEEEEDDSDGEDGVDSDDDNIQLFLSAEANIPVAVSKYYWSSHQHFFRNLCISLKLPHCVQLTNEALAKNQSVIIGLQSTGESSMTSSSTPSQGENIEEFISSPETTLLRLIYRLFPIPPNPLMIATINDGYQIATNREKRAAQQEAPVNYMIDDGSVDGSGSDSEYSFEHSPVTKKASTGGTGGTRVIYDSEDEGELDSTAGKTQLGADLSSSSHSTPAKTSAAAVIESSSPPPAVVAVAVDIDEDGEEESLPAMSDKKGAINNWNISWEEGWIIDPNPVDRRPKAPESFSFSQYLHRRIRRVFVYKKKETAHLGQIIAFLPAVRNDGEELWHVLYDDGDEEDINREEVSYTPMAAVLPLNSSHLMGCLLPLQMLECVLEEPKTVTIIPSTTPNKKKDTKSSSSTAAGKVTKKASQAKDTPKDSPNNGSSSSGGKESDKPAIFVSRVDNAIQKTTKEIHRIKSSEEYQSLNETITAEFPTYDTALSAVLSDDVDRNTAIKFMRYLTALEGRLRYLEMIKLLHLPGNPLDILIDELGGEGNVAEMTGRRHRIIRRNGKLIHEKRGESTGIRLEKQNLYERDLFQRGMKRIAIISDAASAGISLHADKRYPGHIHQRVHITLELPWSADKAIQQLGRSHRSNQSSSPNYHLILSPQGGERRFASAVAKRLQSLGALTQGDRSATVGTKSISMTDFNLDTKYGHKAIREFSKLFQIHQSSSLIRYLSSLPEDIEMEMKAAIPAKQMEELDWSTIRGNDSIYCSLFCQVALKRFIDVDLRLATEFTVATFLNRLLGLPCSWQKMFFDLYLNIFEIVTKSAKKDSQIDQGVFEIRGNEKTVANLPELIWSPGELDGEDESVWHYTISVDKGCSWEDSQTILKDTTSSSTTATVTAVMKNREITCGYYHATNPQLKRFVLLAMEKKTTNEINPNIQVYRPTTGLNEMNRNDFKSKYKQMKDMEAMETLWNDAYDNEKNQHMRFSTYHLMTGSILYVWRQLEKLFHRIRGDGRQLYVRIARVRIPIASEMEVDESGSEEEGNGEDKEGKETNKKSFSSSSEYLSLIGVLIPSQYIDEVVEKLTTQ